jgi:hypothetical protein
MLDNIFFGAMYLAAAPDPVFYAHLLYLCAYCSRWGIDRAEPSRAKPRTRTSAAGSRLGIWDPPYSSVPPAAARLPLLFSCTSVPPSQEIVSPSPLLSALAPDLSLPASRADEG